MDSNESLMADIKNTITKYYNDPQNSALLLDVIKLFWQGSFHVPMTAIVSEQDQEQFLNAKKGDRIETKESIRLRPDLLRAGDNTLWYPAFTSPEETDENYRNRFSWIPVEGKSIINIVLNNQNLSGIVINAFSKNLKLTKQLLQFAVKGSVQEHTLEKGTSVVLGMTGNEEKALREAAVSFMKGKPAIRKAFIALMQQNGETSYLLVVDAPGENAASLFGSFNTALQSLNPRYPIDFVPYLSMKDQLAQYHILPFYCSADNRIKTITVPMEKTKSFYMTEYKDEEGWPQGYSFDFKYASNNSYYIWADDAFRLIQILRKASGKADSRLIVLVHDWLAGTLSTPDKIEDCIRRLLYNSGCIVERLHCKAEQKTFLDRTGNMVSAEELLGKCCIAALCVGKKNDGLQAWGEVVYIGRDSSRCQLVFPQSDQNVSRVHCKLRIVDRSTIELTDMNSTNGTFLADGSRVAANSKIILQSGDVFRVGGMENIIRVFVLYP